MTARYFVVATLMRQAQGGYANLILDTQLKKHPLEVRERAFATSLFYCVLEHQATLDYILNQFSKKQVAKLDEPIREILRSGLAQARYMNVPPSAAVNEAVKLAKAFRKTSAAGMVNAILRRAISYDLETASFQNKLEQCVVLGSVSEDVAKFFLEYYPEDALAILTATVAEKVTAIRVNCLKTTSKILEEQLLAGGAKAVKTTEIPNCLLVEFNGNPAEHPAFAEGLFHVEGQTSQLAALALEAKPHDTIIDFCAAPGGKSLAIAQQMGDTGTLYSCDVSQNRVSLIEKALERGNITCAKVCQNDAATKNPAGTQVDRILTDVPCSGLGILAQKPDIRYKNLSGQEELVALQGQILENAAASLKTGGRLVYSTCTIHPDENQNQIKSFLNRHAEFTVVPIQYLPAGMNVNEYGALSIPNHTGMEGFFICAMEKH